MYKAQKPNVTVDSRGIHYPEDTAQSLTTLHCNRNHALWRRIWVVENKIPVEARRMWHRNNRAQWREFHRATKAVTQAKKVIRFDAWYKGGGMWAYKAAVADGKLVACDYISKDAPVCNGILRKYGTYRQPMAVFTKADDVRYYVRTMCK